MDKRDILELLDRAYELEGLLHLALARVDDLPAQLPELICAKIDELSELSEESEPSEQSDEPELSELPEESELSDKSDNSDKSVISDISDDSDYSDNSEYSDSSDSADYSQNYSEPQRDRRVAARPTGIFSLNDRFLYIRELFDGKASAFDDSLTALASMENMFEAEEYFYGECGFNPENDIVSDFMKRVALYLEGK